MNSRQTAPADTGVLSYLTPTAEHSLHRNGKVLTRRDADGSDGGSIGIDKVKYEVPLHDARQLPAEHRCTLAKNGFELIDSPLKDSGYDFLNHQQVTGTYYRDCERIVQQATGATQVYAFDHNVRSASGKRGKTRIDGGQQVQGPARMVHGDYTLTSAPQRLRDLTGPPGANDTLRSILTEGDSLLDAGQIGQVLDSGRFAIINLWRNIAPEPVMAHPLALCDGQSVEPEDLVVFEIHYGDRVGENYFAKHSAKHRWFYFPKLTRDEALLIKQWDSNGTMARSDGARSDNSVPDAPCTFSFHTAFTDPTTPDDAPDRWSIEVRCIAIY